MTAKSPDAHIACCRDLMESTRMLLIVVAVIVVAPTTEIGFHRQEPTTAALLLTVRRSAELTLRRGGTPLRTGPRPSPARSSGSRTGYRQQGMRCRDQSVPG